MGTLSVLFARSHTVGGLLIRAGQWFAPWNHCAIVTGTGTVVNALAFKGVVEEPVGTFLARYSKVEPVEIRCPYPELAIEYALAQKGKGYDYGAIVNMISSAFASESTDRVMCVELLEQALIAGGADRFRIHPSEVTVMQSYITR